MAERMVELGAERSLATQDPTILERLLRDGTPATIEFVLGVRRDHARHLAHQGHTVRILVPFGRRWFRCTPRRVAESIGA